MNVRLVPFIVLVISTSCHADIFRWDNGELIPGTEGIEPGPEIDLSGMELPYADLRGQSLIGANFYEANLTKSNLSNTDLTDAILWGATLTDADMTDAAVNGACICREFIHAKSGQLAREQFESTASFKAKDLSSIDLSGNDMTEWDFSGQILEGAKLSSLLTIAAVGAILVDANFSQANLANADFAYASLRGANFSDAIVEGVNLSGTPSRGFTSSQLYSTLSYQLASIPSIQFACCGQFYPGASDLSSWDFSSHDLSGAVFFGQDLRHAELQHATLINADMRWAYLQGTDLSNADLSNADLENAGYDQWTKFPSGFDPTAAGLLFGLTQVGDINSNGELDASDLDLLSAAVTHRFPEPGHWPNQAFDLNDDDFVNAEDVRAWVDVVRVTWFGDANLDGEFNSSDLVEVFGAGEYEDAIEDNSGWAEGDWNADGEFDSSDLVVAFADGGYEQGPRVPVNAVPEPSAALLILIGLLALRRHRYST